MNFFQFLYDRNRFIRASLNKLGFSRPIKLALTSPRIVEYPWVLRNLPSEGRILDVGSTGSQLPMMLVGLGYEVWTIDVRKYEYENISHDLHCVKCDIRNTNFSDSFFDIVIAVSTIEHIGLGRYGDMIDKEGDKKAIKEIKRIMTNEGILLMTVPFGNPSISILHRTYNQKSLLTLLNDYKILSVDYFLKTNAFWIKSSIEKIKDVDYSINERAIACVKAYAY